MNLKAWLGVISTFLAISMLVFLEESSLISSNSLMTESNLTSLSMLLKGLGLFFLASVIFITLLVYFWAKYYMSSLYKLTFFYIVLGIFVVSMLLLSLSDSLLGIFIGWEGLGISSFALIIFYQNWLSLKGGLLTLLTNRLGDAILLMVFCWWLSVLGTGVSKINSIFLGLVFSALAFTKSAQWPFISWLPAAMAAPTPVSALVHSSTLVTAGIWLLIRFGLFTSFSMVIWFIFGMLTLSVASLSALLEMDAKKIVALSTLSQLGLMVVSLTFGTFSMCFFHILMHAFAKANLFLVVGSLLFSSFSQQDTRFISTTSLYTFLIFGMTVSLLSLTGFSFLSGFFSKDQILLGQYFNTSSITSWIVIIFMTGLTLAYCFKLFLSVLSVTPQSMFVAKSFSFLCVMPIFLLSAMSIILGGVSSWNFSLCSLTTLSKQGSYWSVGFMGVMLMLVMFYFVSTTFGGFYSQVKLIDSGLKMLSSLKGILGNLEASGSEGLILITSFNLSAMSKQTLRVVFLTVAMMLVLVMA